MTPESSTETCPSCRDGVLLRAEQRPDGFAKHFSCGHTHYSVELQGKMNLSDHLGVEHRLGPHSTETVTYSHAVGVDAFVVHMPQEMYKDALWFFREARKNHGANGDPFVTWRNVRAAILFAFAAIEACINQFIEEHIDGNKSTLVQRDIDYWTEKIGFVSINKKLNDGVEFFGGKRLDNDPVLWLDYTELKELRDGLVHYKVANRLFYKTDELLKRTEKGIQTAGAVIQKIYLAHPANTAYPPTFDELP